MSSRTLYAQHPVSLKMFHLSPVLAYVLRFFIAGQIQHRTVHRLGYTPAQVDAPMYSSRLYAKNSVFEIVHEESVKVYHLHMYNGNIQQNSLCVESCVTEEFHISPRFSLHLRLPAAVAELAVYAVDEHRASVLCEPSP